MANEEIKSLIKRYRLFRYEVADAIGISEGRFSALLRKPLSKKYEQKVMEAVEKLTSETKERD